LTRKRRLCDVKPLGCPPEMLFFADSNKVAQMPQFHIHTSKASTS
jgi:hypothetical protein